VNSRRVEPSPRSTHQQFGDLCLLSAQRPQQATMPGLIPHRRNSDEMSEDDEELADGDVTPSSQMPSSSKRPRFDQEESSEVRSDVRQALLSCLYF